MRGSSWLALVTSSLKSDSHSRLLSLETQSGRKQHSIQHPIPISADDVPILGELPLVKHSVCFVDPFFLKFGDAHTLFFPCCQDFFEITGK